MMSHAAADFSDRVPFLIHLSISFMVCGSLAWIDKLVMSRRFGLFVVIQSRAVLKAWEMAISCRFTGFSLPMMVLPCANMFRWVISRFCKITHVVMPLLSINATRTCAGI